VSGSGRSREVLLLGLGRFPAARDRRLASWVEALVAEMAPNHDSFAVRLVGDRTMRAFNRDFRGVDKTTDVLSFPGQGGADGRHLGDVVISAPQAVRQAGAAGHSVARELRILVLHGLLHCLGYDHESDGGEMERLERRLRRRWLGEA
jgi:probable rRNA maturation factor